MPQDVKVTSPANAFHRVCVEKYPWHLNSGSPVSHSSPVKIDPISH